MHGSATDPERLAVADAAEHEVFGILACDKGGEIVDQKVVLPAPKRFSMLAMPSSEWWAVKTERDAVPAAVRG